MICEGLTDPHNLGAVIRTADAAGCHGVIIPKEQKRSAEFYGRQGRGGGDRAYPGRQGVFGFGI